VEPAESGLDSFKIAFKFPFSDHPAVCFRLQPGVPYVMVYHVAAEELPGGIGCFQTVGSFFQTGRKRFQM
jgi:hypothetical protein